MLLGLCGAGASRSWQGLWAEGQHCPSGVVRSRRGVGSPTQAPWAAPLLSPAAAMSQRFCTTCPRCLCPRSRVQRFSVCWQSLHPHPTACAPEWSVEALSVLPEPGLTRSLVPQAGTGSGSSCSLEGKCKRVQGGKWLPVSGTDSQQVRCSARSKACLLLELLLHHIPRLMLWAS